MSMYKSLSLSQTADLIAAVGDVQTVLVQGEMGIGKSSILSMLKSKPEFKDHPLCGHGRFRGVMAQEVEQIIPEAVTTMDNGYKAVKYDFVEAEMV